MVQSQKYLGIGIQRKGQALPNVVVGWFCYYHDERGLKLEFKGRDCKQPVQALDLCHELIGQIDYACCFYSERGSGFYLEREYRLAYGGLSETKGQFLAYDEDQPADDDPTYTRLAWDVHRLRQVEMEWPEEQFRTPWKNFRQQLRTCELNDEPGRGPLKRVLTATQKEMQTEWVPAAAMAFQALRRGWSEYGLEQGVQEEDQLLTAYEAAAGTPEVLGLTRPMHQDDDDEKIELDDPQYVYAQDRGEFEDFESEFLY